MASSAFNILYYSNNKQTNICVLYQQVATLHGELSKVQRANILNDFRRDRLRALMVSDLVARGLDVSDCDAGGFREKLTSQFLPVFF